MLHSDWAKCWISNIRYLFLVSTGASYRQKIQVVCSHLHFLSPVLIYTLVILRNRYNFLVFLQNVIRTNVYEDTKKGLS